MPIDKQPWNDETVMPWGQHKGKKLSELPASYLLWLFEQRWIKDWPGLHAYLKKNEDLLMAEKRENQGSDSGMRSPDSMSSYDDYLEER